MRSLFYIFIILLLLPGCGTYLMMSEGTGVDIVPYCGTLVDSVVFLGLITGREGPDGILLALCALVDLPFSLIADTFCLPYTLLKWIF